MVKDFDSILSDNSKRMKKSAIRELLKLTNKPGLISFAGGLPSPLTFPIKELQEISCEVLETEGPAALQYSTTEGNPGLRKVLAERYAKQGLNITSNNIIIVTSSQQALDLIPKVLVNPGDKVLVELPSYLGGIQSFQNYGANMIGVKHDKYGMRADVLEEELSILKKVGEKPKFIYIIPDFQNPAGVTMPEWRRLEIIKIAQKYDVLIVEDSPYRELRFEGESQKTFYQLADEGRVILLGTFSKLFVPGFRIGWIIGHEAILDKIVTAKQSTDLCTSSFVQMIATKYIEKGYFDKNLNNIITMYKAKKDVMMDSFEKYLPEGVTWTNPEGGLFLFVTLPEWMDAEELFITAIENNVAFVIGKVFHCDESGKNTMRINFSFASHEEIVEGVKRLGKAIKAMMDNKKA
ncbi:MAG TPA: PLP-dependent aminotransferase family protein [Clostridiales bacterium]|jgi:2-aminoadipate transaminase|nr:PLP-dependent aminotransferase family protein [Clostridiales bacterium]HQP70961.1 PLP-dependent aminotransferase family protein [Clostridiales bacterium]